MSDTVTSSRPDIAPHERRSANIARLLISCVDRPGIVAAVTNFLAGIGANIVHSDQHTANPFGGQFFMRIEFCLPDLVAHEAALSADFEKVARSLNAQWRLSLAERPKRVAIFASKADHALQELLWRFSSGDMTAEVQMIISNHETFAPLASRAAIPFFHVPKSAHNKADAEARELELLHGKVDLIVLARYMQIISPHFLSHFPNQVINIHHSFLPAFVGADPYRAAYARGVKLVGATAHYVTEDLDAGPIIEQDVVRVTHAHTVEDLRRLGRFVERSVLAQAVEWHLDDRVIVHGNKTVVFQ